MVKKVTKAVIVAAGLGKRMFPFTKIDSKLLIPILNKPIVLYLMEELKASGIEEVTIVTNHPSKLQQFFTENKKLNQILEKLERTDLIRELHRIENMMSKIRYIRQEEPKGWVHALLQAKELVKEEPFAVVFSDCLFKSKTPITKRLIDAYYLENKNISCYGVRFVFKPNIFKLIEKFSFNLGDDSIQTKLINILEEKKDISEISRSSDFFDVGDPISLLRTLFIFSLEDWYYSKKLHEEFLEDPLLKKDFKKFYEMIIRNEKNEKKE